MLKMRLVLVLFILALTGCAMNKEIATTTVKTRADTLPRKVIVATAMQRFRGPLEDRLKLAEEVIAEAGKEAEKKYPGRRLDLVVLPEYAIATKEGMPVKFEGQV